MSHELDVEAFNASVLEVTMAAQEQGAEIEKLQQSLASSREVLQNLEARRSGLLSQWMDDVAQQPALYGASYYLDERSKTDIGNLNAMHARGEFLCNLAARAHESALPVLAIRKTNDTAPKLKGTQPRETKEPTVGFYAQLGETASDTFRIERDAELGSPKSLRLCLQKVVTIESVTDPRVAVGGSKLGSSIKSRTEYAEISLLDRSSSSLNVPNKLVHDEDGEPKEIDIKSRSNIYVGELAVRKALLHIVDSVNGRKHDEVTLRAITDEIAR